jgi:hypothetical protein
MPANLRIFCQPDDEGGTIVRLSGVVDETLDRAALSAAGLEVVFDLDGVHRITSYGVREWVKAMEVLPVLY